MEIKNKYMKTKPISILFCLILLIIVADANAQIPNPLEFNTAANGVNSKFTVGSLDTNWLVAIGDLNSPTTMFVPSIVVGQCYPSYYQSPFTNADWISYNFGSNCQHTGSYDFYFRRIINLPQTNPCGTPISQNFCLAINFFVDNFVSEISVNGVVNYQNTDNDPYYYLGFQSPDSANICNGWTEGENTLIVHIKSAAPAAALLLEANLNIINEYYAKYEISESICQGNSIYEYSTTGIYVDTIFSSSGCDTIRTVNLTVLPPIASTETVSICQGQEYLGYTLSGTYVDTYQTLSGCDSIRTLTIMITPGPTSYHYVTICEDSTYDFNGNLLFAEGLYFDTIPSILGCDSVVTLDLRIARSSFLGNDTTLCGDKEYQLISSLDNTLWFDNDLSKTKIVDKTGNYWASYTDNNGCKIVDSIFVEFKNVRIYTPNVFSPNEDGLNDCFHPFFSEIEFLSYRFSIFDRWGNHIYSTSNLDDCWNGEFMGKKCNLGVYVYFIEINSLFCGMALIKGDVTLIR